VSSDRIQPWIAAVLIAAILVYVFMSPEFGTAQRIPDLTNAAAVPSQVEAPRPKNPTSQSQEAPEGTEHTPTVQPTALVPSSFTAQSLVRRDGVWWTVVSPHLSHVPVEVAPREATVSGVLLDPQGNPSAGIVYVLPADARQAHLVSEVESVWPCQYPSEGVRVGESGAFTLPELPCEEWRVIALPTEGSSLARGDALVPIEEDHYVEIRLRESVSVSVSEHETSHVLGPPGVRIEGGAVSGISHSDTAVYMTLDESTVETTKIHEGKAETRAVNAVEVRGSVYGQDQGGFIVCSEHDVFLDRSSTGQPIMSDEEDNLVTVTLRRFVIVDRGAWGPILLAPGRWKITWSTDESVIGQSFEVEGIRQIWNVAN